MNFSVKYYNCCFLSNIETPYLLPLDESLHRYLTSSIFLPNNIWKITFSSCSHYLAIPKQDIYGHDCIIIIYCPNWHANSKTDELYVHEELKCSSTVWSLAFGQQSNFSRQCHSNLSSVNRRYDFTKNLFLAAGLADGKINIWNIDTGELTLILTDHKSTVCGLAFTVNSMQLVSCSYDKTIKFWNLLDDGEKNNLK
jgi:WD40 repeat protein